MQRIKLSDTLNVSRLIYGMWRLGDNDEASPNHIAAKLEACLDQGLTTLDQADIYGGYRSETLLGNCFRGAPGLRDRFELITKCGIIGPFGRYADRRVKHYDTSRSHLIRSVESSLKAMHTDRIDLLLIHRPDPFMDHEETGRALDELVTSGKVITVGVSNFKPHDWNLLQSAMSARLVTNQIEISVSAIDPFRNGEIAHLQMLGVPPMAWSPLAGGRLFRGEPTELRKELDRLAKDNGTDVSAVAIAWLLAHPAGILPVVGTNSLPRIARLKETFNVKLSREDWFAIYAASLGHEVP